MQVADYQDIPFNEELFLHTFSFLDAPSLFKAGGVNKRWRRISCDSTLWTPLLRSLFPYIAAEGELRDFYLKRKITELNFWKFNYQIGSPQSLPKKRCLPMKNIDVAWSTTDHSFLIGSNKITLPIPRTKTPKYFKVCGDRLITYSQVSGSVFLHDLTTLAQISQVNVSLLPYRENYFLECMHIEGGVIALPYERGAKVHLIDLKSGKNRSVSLVGEYIKHDKNLTIYTELKGRFISCLASHYFDTPPTPKSLGSECVLV